jgi:exodeoxyribonuclease V gamma subunit
LPFKTALSLVADQDAATTYEGGYMVSAEVDEPCLSRMFPDFDALEADERFQTLAREIYGPLLQWAKEQVQVEVYAAEGQDALTTDEEVAA